MREKEITDLVERFLLERGYVCRREIRLKYRTADIVGYKPPKKFIAVEVKSDIDDPIRGIGQAIAYGASVDESFLAVDEKRFEEIRDIVRYVPLGILVASRKGLVLWKKPQPFRPKTFWKDYLKGVFLKTSIVIEQQKKLPQNISPEIKRLKRSLTIDSLWFWILRILIDTPCHAYILKDLIRKRFDFSPSLIVCYKVIYFLEKGGYVKPRKEGNRKIYFITKKGELELEKGRKFIDEIIS